MSATSTQQQAVGASSAAGPALGYLVQVEYALLLLLQRMDDEDNCAVAIETLDDITFHDEAGTPTEKLQSKHHVNRGSSLSNASSDLWKPMGTWIAEHSPTIEQLVLLSTDSARVGSAASHLSGRAEHRDVARAQSLLEETARDSSSKANEAYYAEFLRLTPAERRALLDRVVVLDSSVAADGLTDALLRLMRRSARADRRSALVERLRGWWHGRVLAQLIEVARGEANYITSAETEDRIHLIAQSLRDDNLPIDFDDLPEPTAEEVDADTSIFVEQLRLIMLGSNRLRQCIYDHNRAYMQRSEWQRERLLHVGELDRYDRRLQDEWRRHFTPLTDDSSSAEEERLEWARQAFFRLDTSSLPSVRSEVTAPYVANGSLHILADRLKIGWHPEWVQHLRARINEVDFSAQGQSA
jgi:hypothetical protein